MSWVCDVSRCLGMVDLERYLQKTTQSKSGTLRLKNVESTVNGSYTDTSELKKNSPSQHPCNITFNSTKPLVEKKPTVQLTFYDVRKSPLGGDFEGTYISSPCLVEDEPEHADICSPKVILSPSSAHAAGIAKSYNALQECNNSSSINEDSSSYSHNRSLSTSQLDSFDHADVVDTPIGALADHVKSNKSTSNSLEINTKYLLSALSKYGRRARSNSSPRLDCSVQYSDTPPRSDISSAKGPDLVQDHTTGSEKCIDVSPSPDVYTTSRDALVSRLCGFVPSDIPQPPPLPASDHPRYHRHTQQLPSFTTSRKTPPFLKKRNRMRISDSSVHFLFAKRSKSEHNLAFPSDKSSLISSSSHTSPCPVGSTNGSLRIEHKVRSHMGDLGDWNIPGFSSAEHPISTRWSWNINDWKGFTKDMIHSMPHRGGTFKGASHSPELRRKSGQANGYAFLPSSGQPPPSRGEDTESSEECRLNTKVVRRTHSDTTGSLLSTSGDIANRNVHYSRQYSTPQTIKIRPLHRLPDYSGDSSDGGSQRRSSYGRLRRSTASTHLRRSVSQPLDLDKSFENQVAKLKNLTTANRSVERRPSVGNLLSDDTNTSEEDVGTSDSEEFRRDLKRCLEEEEDVLVYAEALWDHVSLDADELVFKAGDLIAVVDSSDRDWWWGRISNRAGWFPKAFVRLLVNQEDHVDKPDSPYHSRSRQWACRKPSISGLSQDQIRSNVINEIICTEREYVKHLRDVVEGYLRQVRKRPDMFTIECIATIFGNIEALYAFQSGFLSQLEKCIDFSHPYKSVVGDCFIRNRSGFEIYSEYCNNHPSAVSELQDLYRDSRYVHFFEACRLLQEMIDISLDGFLLTPVQKICKYPLQLQELLKYTKPGHPDYSGVRGAMQSMKEVALLVNERKRRMECLEKIASWQIGVEGWEGPDLLEDSSQLIHQGDVTKGLSGSWRPKEVSLFLFDHQLVYCKRDLLKRNTFVYRGRVNTDLCQVFDMNQGKESINKAGPQHAFKVHCLDRHKTYVFGCKTASDKYKWLAAFNKERDLVSMDETAGFVVSEKQKMVAKMSARNQKNRPKRPRSLKTQQSLTFAQANVLINDQNTNFAATTATKSNSLPLGVQRPDVKKKGLWFNFGGNKKGRISGRSSRTGQVT